MSALLQIEGLDVRLGLKGARLLRSVSLTVDQGEAHGLVGESGAGKSMIGKAVAGLLPRGIAVTRGSIRFDGQDLLALPGRTRRRVVGERIAIIPQDPLTALNPCRRIEGQMTDRLIHILGWPRPKARQRAAELLEEVAIREPERVMRAYPHELSGGMRQRVLIAAAFVADPALIIADEPTTALDVTVQRQVLRLIRDLQARHDTALLFVTHDMGVVAKLCRSLTVLYAGHVVDQGDAGRIFGTTPHAYTRALIAATPRYDRPEESLQPVPPQVIADLDRDIAQADAQRRHD